MLLHDLLQQARDQLRIRWFPTADLKTRPNERVYTVLDELRQTLALLQGAEFEFKNHLARRLARELFKREQAQLAAELIPVALFGAAEQDEAKALVALELYRADKGSELAQEAAEDLKGRGADLIKGVPTPASAQTLFLALDTQQAPRVAAPPTSNPVADPARFAYCGKALLDNQADEALNLARRPGPLEGQVRALVLCADWGTDPTAALDATIQAQILALLASVRRDTGMALVLISHDLGVVAENVDRVAVSCRSRVRAGRGRAATRCVYRCGPRGRARACRPDLGRAVCRIRRQAHLAVLVFGPGKDGNFKP